MSLPLVKNTKKITEPLTEATTRKMIEVLNHGSLPAIEYGAEVFVAADKRAGSPPHNQKMVQTFLDYVKTAKDLAQAAISPFDTEKWKDTNPVRELQKYLAAAARAVTDVLAEGVQSAVQMLFSFEQTGRFMRIYLMDEKPVDEAKVEELDRYWNHWLTLQDMKGEDGVIFRTDQHGLSTGDRVTEAQLKRLIGDKNHGLEAFFKSQKANVLVNEYQEPTPTQAVDIDSAAQTDQRTRT